jgi:hypothetical protein
LITRAKNFILSVSSEGRFFSGGLSGNYPGKAKPPVRAWLGKQLIKRSTEVERRYDGIKRYCMGNDCSNGGFYRVHPTDDRLYNNQLKEC